MEITDVTATVDTVMEDGWERDVDDADGIKEVNVVLLSTVEETEG